MIPAHFLPSKYSFQVCNGEVIRVLLVTEALSLQAATRPTEPLWYMEVGDHRSLEAVLRWLRFRRALWSSWGSLAQKKGHKALAKHMRRLLREDPPAEVIGFLLERGERRDEILIGESVASPNGLDKRLYHRHRFPSADHCNVFCNWLLSNNPEVNGSALLETALNDGGAQLSNVIEQITREEFALNRKAA